MKKSSVYLKREKNEITIEVEGALTENTSFPNIDIDGVNKIIFNLDRVVRVNSLGISLWLMFFRKLLDQFPQIDLEFVKCPTVVVEQFNIVKEFLPTNSCVSSFYVPYFSSETNKTKFVLYENGKDYFWQSEKSYKDLKLKSEYHEENDIFMIDTVKEKYFNFLKSGNI